MGLGLTASENPILQGQQMIILSRIRIKISSSWQKKELKKTPQQPKPIASPVPNYPCL
uniref:Uncharacterized protein n=1 Tax=Nelumbo nucifera TaxID=4432 RepID=A0A822YZ88_NELNU|nr:TPA_asm: hypothetical protein HUJ06_008477 [Nelumbo nucifera]